VSDVDEAQEPGEDLSTWIRRQMDRRDWKAADLSRHMGVGSGRISEWLNRQRRPSPESCIKLADVFGADPDDVLALAGHREPLEPLDIDDPKRRIIALIRKAPMTPSQANGLEAMLRSWIETNGSEVRNGG
jgi:transcriptional regulator with XRE-family HTH domain